MALDLILGPKCFFTQILEWQVFHKIFHCALTVRLKKSFILVLVPQKCATKFEILITEKKILQLKQSATVHQHVRLFFIQRSPCLKAKEWKRFGILKRDTTKKELITNSVHVTSKEFDLSANVAADKLCDLWIALQSLSWTDFASTWTGDHKKIVHYTCMIYPRQ